MVLVTAIIDGKTYDSVVELHSLEVLATFDNSSVQPNINIENLTLVNEAAVAVRAWGEAGLNGGYGYLEGMPIVLMATDTTGTYPPMKMFDGYIDFTQAFTIISPVKVSVKIVKHKSLNDLETKLSALTYGYLVSNGRITSADFTTIKTVVIPFNQDFQNLMLAFMEFTMLRELYFVVLKVQSDAAILLTQPTSSAATAAATLVLDLVYAALLVVQVVKLTKKLIDIFFAIPANNKAMTFHALLSKACEQLGYTFQTSVTELSRWAYVPSKPDKDTVFNNEGLTKGIPQANDFGYKCDDMFEVACKLTNSKVAVIGNTVQLHNATNKYWNRVSNFDINKRKPIAAIEKIEYNISECIGTRIINFQTDVTDDWTVKNFTGTNYEIITDAVVVGNSQNKLNRGLEQIEIPLSLGNTNDRFEGFQTLLVNVYKEVDKLLAKLGSKISLSSKILNRGVPMKVSTSTWTVPKIVEIASNGNIKANQRNYISAKILWNSFYKTNRSFLYTNPYGQKRLYNNVNIAFGLTDFMMLMNCGYFSGGVGKMESVLWKFDKDTAECTWSEYEVWTKNLKEIFIEP